MKIDDKKLKEVLLKQNYLLEEDIKKADAYLAKHKVSFGDYLIQSNLLNKKLIGEAVAEFLEVPFADIESKSPTKEQILKIPEAIAKKNHLILFEEEEKAVVVATDDPEQKQLQSALKKIFKGKKIKLAYAATEDIEAKFTNYQKPLDTRFSKIIKSEKRIAPEILDEIFNDSIVFNASDIHFEPQKEEVILRFRIDGLMREAGRIPLINYENILNRIKIQSGLRIDEHYAAQDGSIRYENNNLSIDFRTSIVPTVNGEKIVLRVLASYVKGLSLSELGLSMGDREILEEVSKKPFGMILVTGPTGSGKTTTLYATLKMLNSPDVNVTTIEDPVEYKIEGLNQIQVNGETNLTFAKGLRSIVRQDPDIILVGEIRDTETAEIAVNAALTGHLLLSTFHANDAATAIPRLLDMGVQPFLLASTMEAVIAQRLVRKICKQCRRSVTLDKKNVKLHLKELKQFFGKEKVNAYEGKGCDACNGTGFKGRTAIYEFIRFTPEMKSLVLQNPSTNEIWALARKQGATSLFEDGIEKVKNGLTTLEELLRVAEPPTKNK